MSPFARPLRLLQQGLLCACLLAAGGALASSDDDHEQARRAVARGEVLPLKQVLQHLEKQRPGGQVLEVELEKEEGLWVYEIKQLETGGLIVKLKLDAKTGVLLHAKPRRKS
ncbi:PepSY domain-containing protein [Ideonella sp.]|jgi:uncharacterized membrane protein YkoI|uniref:PepSY domain-containing protein n=1 Tax=Ideonella sp. TaxID=1929293 RepID=UPI0037BEA00E